MNKIVANQSLDGFLKANSGAVVSREPVTVTVNLPLYRRNELRQELYMLSDYIVQRATATTVTLVPRGDG